jgi:diguanylate cyclase (GGDEF)-like protein/PAS domain S-box-containing protein
MKNTLKNHTDLELRHRKYINVALVLSALLFITLISFLSYYQINRLTGIRSLIMHGYEVVRRSNNILSQMLTMENQQLMYVLTKNKSYLLTHDQHARDINDNLSELNTLVAAEADQKKQVLLLNELMTKRLALLQQISPEKKYIEKNRNTILENIGSLDLGENLSEQIKDIASTIRDQEIVMVRLTNNTAYGLVKGSSIFLFALGIVTSIFLLIYFTLLNRQLSQRIAAENKVKHLEKQTKSIIENISDAIAAVDLDGNYMLFNTAYARGAEKFFHKSLTMGMNIKEAFANMPVHKERVLHMWQRSLSGEEFSETIDVDGYTYEINSSIIVDENNQLIGATHVDRDITKRVQQEKEVKELNQKLEQGISDLAEQNKKMHWLIEMSEATQACNTTEEVIKAITIYCEKILNFTRGVIYILREADNTLEKKACWNNPQRKPEFINPEDCWAWRRGRLYEVTEFEKNIVCGHLELKGQEKFNPYICIPLMAHNNIIGSFYLELTVPMDEAKRLLISAVAETAALSIANTDLREMLHFKSIHDSLTGLYNKRFLAEFFPKTINRAARVHTPLAVVMLDLDSFKQFNDTLGHEAGDLLLNEFGKFLQSEVRSSDIACRYGGEEFILLLDNCNLESAKQRVEELQTKFAKHQIIFDGKMLSLVTFSAGISSFPAHGSNPGELIDAADQALYETKRGGGKQVIIFKK